MADAKVSTDPHAGDLDAVPAGARSAGQSGPPVVPLSSPGAPDERPSAVSVAAARPSRTFTGRRRVRARRVRRVVRHVDPWSVFKVGIVFCLCMYGALLVAIGLLWRAALRTGLLDNVESFLVDIGLFDSFEFQGDVMFRAIAIGGLVLAVAAAAVAVLMTVVFNLISDLMGGIRVSIIEEDVAYVRDPGAVRDAAAPGNGDRPPSTL